MGKEFRPLDEKIANWRHPIIEESWLKNCNIASNYQGKYHNKSTAMSIWKFAYVQHSYKWIVTNYRDDYPALITELKYCAMLL